MARPRNTLDDAEPYGEESMEPNWFVRWNMVVTSGTPNAAPIRILVADDSDIMRRSLRGLLESQDHWPVCDEVSKGREAVEKVQRNAPDLLLLDFEMPVMNGLEAAREITRRSPGLKGGRTRCLRQERHRMCRRSSGNVAAKRHLLPAVDESWSAALEIHCKKLMVPLLKTPHEPIYATWHLPVPSV
jgi:CheY-like chemotaxis protein